MNDLSFDVIYEQNPEGGYTVYATSLPGCISEGDTFEEATTNIKDAIQLYLESLKADKQEIISKQSSNTLFGTIKIPSQNYLYS